MSNPTYDAIILAAEEYLKNNGHTSQSNPLPSKDLVAAIQQRIMSNELPVDVAPSTILVYISKAANADDSSGLVSGGAWGGYWYDASVVQAATKPIEEAKIENVEGRPVSFLEKDLYPLVEFWLRSKGFEAKDTSNLKGGGKWGNPDILGVRIVELFGAVEIELVSCEVKLKDDNWEQFIFEAISHKRFCNRSWFAYRIAEAGRPLPKGMEYYAERYKVGVLQILLSDDDLLKLKSGATVVLEEFVDRVRETLPALYEPVPLQEKKSLCERAKVSVSITF